LELEAMSQYSKEQDWLISEQDKSAVAFFKAFDLNDKQQAHDRYSRLLKSAPLAKRQRDELTSEFATWKLNHSAEYWLD
ncbi:hypothetical protein BGZ76_004961, partial [Entomortierella beljakovae]